MKYKIKKNKYIKSDVIFIGKTANKQANMFMDRKSINSFCKLITGQEINFL